MKISLVAGSQAKGKLYLKMAVLDKAFLQTVNRLASEDITILSVIFTMENGKTVNRLASEVNTILTVLFTMENGNTIYRMAPEENTILTVVFTMENGKSVYRCTS